MAKLATLALLGALLPFPAYPSALVLHSGNPSNQDSQFSGMHAPSDHSVSCYGVCPDSFYVNLPKTDSATELHIIAPGVTREGELLKNGKYVPATIDVRLFPSPKPITLVLLTPAIRWQISLSSGAHLAKVFLLGPDPNAASVIGDVDPKIVVRETLKKLFYHWERDTGGNTEPVEALLAPIREITKAQEASFQGADRRDFFSVPFYKDRLAMLAREEKAQQEIAQQKSAAENLGAATGQILLIERNVMNLRDLKTHAVVRPVGTNTAYTRYPTAYAVDAKGTPYLISDTGITNLLTHEEMRTTLETGNFSNPECIAYDSRRNRLLAYERISKNLFALPLDTKKWQKLAKLEGGTSGVGFGPLAYSAEDDKLYAFPNGFGGYKFDKIFIFDSEFKPAGELKLTPPIVYQAWGLNYMAMIEGRLIYAVNPTADNNASSATIFSIDPKTGITRREW